MSYELATIPTIDLGNVTGGNGRFDYLMQQKPQKPAPAAPAHGSSGGLGGWLKNMGGKLQGAGEVEAAVGGVGTAVAPESVVPEAVAATGGATWLLGKGMSTVGGWLHH